MHAVTAEHDGRKQFGFVAKVFWQLVLQGKAFPVTVDFSVEEQQAISMLPKRWWKTLWGRSGYSSIDTSARVDRFLPSCSAVTACISSVTCPERR
jgi:hypothetical protein